MNDGAAMALILTERSQSIRQALRSLLDQLDTLEASRDELTDLYRSADDYKDSDDDQELFDGLVEKVEGDLITARNGWRRELERVAFPDADEIAKCRAGV